MKFKNCYLREIISFTKKIDIRDWGQSRPIWATRIWANPYGTNAEPGCTPHMGRHVCWVRSGYSCQTQLVVTAHDLLNFFDQNRQVEIVILDFSNAFDTVPHRKLQHKLDAYGIRGPLHTWIANFLTKRKMNVVVEGKKSRSAHVGSGVLQGTALGPLLFLQRSTSTIFLNVSPHRSYFCRRLLALQANQLPQDHQTLQQDLNNLQIWADDWGMKFNAKKCYLLSTKSKSRHLKIYTINDQILKQVQDNPCLGITFSEDLKWKIHINNTSKKANSTYASSEETYATVHCVAGRTLTWFVSVLN